MKTETSINSFAEEGGDDIFHSWTFWYLHGNFSGFIYLFMDFESIYLYHVPGFAKDGDVVMF